MFYATEQSYLKTIQRMNEDFCFERRMAFYGKNERFELVACSIHNSTIPFLLGKNGVQKTESSQLMVFI